MTEETTEPLGSEEVEALAKNAATFYKTLTGQGVPEQTASGLTQEFNHQTLRSRYQQ